MDPYSYSTLCQLLGSCINVSWEALAQFWCYVLQFSDHCLGLRLYVDHCWLFSRGLWGVSQASPSIWQCNVDYLSFGVEFSIEHFLTLSKIGLPCLPVGLLPVGAYSCSFHFESEAVRPELQLVRAIYVTFDLLGSLFLVAGEGGNCSREGCRLHPLCMFCVWESLNVCACSQHCC